MNEFMKADFDALLRAFFDARPMSKEETDAAKAAMDKMSPWQSMSMDELAEVLKKASEAEANAALHEGEKK